MWCVSELLILERISFPFVPFSAAWCRSQCRVPTWRTPARAFLQAEAQLLVGAHSCDFPPQPQDPPSIPLGSSTRQGMGKVSKLRLASQQFFSPPDAGHLRVVQEGPDRNSPTLLLELCPRPLDGSCDTHTESDT